KNAGGYVPFDGVAPVEIGRYVGNNTYCFDGKLALLRLQLRPLRRPDFRKIQRREVSVRCLRRRESYSRPIFPGRSWGLRSRLMLRLVSETDIRLRVRGGRVVAAIQIRIVLDILSEYI
ncbi:hypothetical protein LCGC14_3005540, partial [marine sediment metagenome]